MKKNIKTEEVLKVYNIIGQAKYQKLSDEDKVKAWKIARQLKPVAAKFDEDSKDAAERLKPEDFDERLEQAREYERVRQGGEDGLGGGRMTQEAYEQFLKELRDYNELVGKALQEYGNKEVEVEFEPLSEDAFGKLMASNEWTMSQAMQAGDFVCG